MVREVKMAGETGRDRWAGAAVELERSGPIVEVFKGYKFTALGNELDMGSV